MALITLKDYAESNGIKPYTAKKKAQRGGFKTAKRIGRDWLIDENEILIDRRRKEFKQGDQNG